MGPGSWFTSVLPHLLVPELATALAQTRARRLVALNLAPQPGETDGFTPHSHLDVLAEHAAGRGLHLGLDVVLADSRVVTDTVSLQKSAESLGGRLVLDHVAAADGTPHHDPERLAAAYAAIFGGDAGECAGERIGNEEGGQQTWR